ncbi:MAG TPA: TetR/AcrR family transcriptional regulator [Burkholderiaceae bacterium]|jgi:AcrR family transcriptional regulator
MMESLPINFTLAEFRAVTPLDESNICGFVFDRNTERIAVKRRGPALENVQKIFDATFHLANTVGFRAMTLRDLCQETGMSMGGLYGYIQNKDQLAAMIEDAVRQVSEQMPTWFTHVKSPVDRVECLLRAFIYSSEILQPWLFFVFLESRALPGEQRKVAKESELRFHSHMAELIEATGQFDADGAFLLAAHCMAFVQDWYVKRWKYHAARIDVDEFAASAVRLLRSRLTVAP